MKVAKAGIFCIDLECPYCMELLENPVHGDLKFEIHESVPWKLKCNSCGKECRAPVKVHGCELTVEFLK